jgi:hypothetical protein
MDATLSASRAAPMRPALSRWKAAGIHLALSAVVAGALVAFLLAVWYPWPLFELAGGSGLMLILVGVDVVLGPLITLIIFRAGKKGLRFDLTLIAALQLAALAYGVHAVYAVRPVYLAFTIDRFNLVTALDVDQADLERTADEQFKQLPLGRPRYVAAIMPQAPAERERILMSGLRGGKDLHQLPQYYRSYETHAREALARAKPLSKLKERNPEVVGEFLASSGRKSESVVYLPLGARHGDGAVLMDSVSGTPVGMLKIDAW